MAITSITDVTVAVEIDGQPVITGASGTVDSPLGVTINLKGGQRTGKLVTGQPIYLVTGKEGKASKTFPGMTCTQAGENPVFEKK